MDPQSTQRLAGKPVAETIYGEIAPIWQPHRGTVAIPTLASVAVGEDGPFRLYQRMQRRSFEKQGLGFREVVLPTGVDPGEIAKTLGSLNRDETVHGIILQHPLPPDIDFFRLASGIAPAKDIDGVGAENLGRLMSRRPLHVPAVALAGIEILRFYKISPAGKRVVVVGRSETVGLPTALLLLMKGTWGDATVTVAHSKSPDLDKVVKTADIVFPCAGQHGIVNRKNLRRGATVVDIGLSEVPDPKVPGATLMVGDADAGKLEGWAGALTPVPGGVGPVTVAELIRNTVVAWSYQEGIL